MFGGTGTLAGGKDPAACSGCSLCLLVCPVWRRTHDPRMTPEGRAKALQHGATAADLAGSIESCELCGACEPVCPERIDLVGMTLDLRTRLADTEALAAAQMRASRSRTEAGSPPVAAVVLLPGPALRKNPGLLERVRRLLGATACLDEADDVALALESGIPVPAERLAHLRDAMRHAKTIIVEDGLWRRHLRAWLPKARVMGLGEALSARPSLRSRLKKTDLYVIEPRSYHGDYERLVKYYDRLRAERGCAFNLDLQRIAIPPLTQADWILKGLQVERIVVERMEDAAAFQRTGAAPVVHVAELADH